MSSKYNTIIIGGGFYGLRVAQFLYDELKQKRILIIEKEPQVVGRASYSNQARVHSGYHYPRSVLTALRSKVNQPIFTAEYEDAITSDFTQYYAVAKTFSKVNAKQFRRFFERIDAEIKIAPKARKYFNPNMIEEVFLVKEFAFNASKLKKNLLNNISKRPGISISTNEEVVKVQSRNKTLQAITKKRAYESDYIINASYSSINAVNSLSDLPIIPLKHELAELCLVDPPEALEGKGFTVMCGPFFSLMPFPAKNTYSLSHVRYTPHNSWQDEPGLSSPLNDPKTLKTKTHFPQMHADLKRYMPLAENLKYNNESLWEIKTVLPQSENDDSRPILFKKHHGGLHNYVCIMGGKIDNIYDVFKELKTVYA